MAVSFPKVIRKLVNSLQAGEIKNVDSVPTSSFKQIDYFVNVMNGDESKVFTASVIVNKLNGSVSHQVVNKTGNMSIFINPKLVSGNFVLEFINTQSEALAVTLARTLI